MSKEFKLASLSHHAYCLVGGDFIHDWLMSELEKRHNIPIHGNADLFDKKYASFTIDDARELKALHETRPTGKMGMKIFIISMDAITVEAQNALLKLLEEPAEYAHFFLIIPSTYLLLPTVKSRLAFIENGDRAAREAHGEDIGDDANLNAARLFLKSTVSKRLEQVKKLVDDISQEKKTRHDAIEFLDAVQEVVYKEKGVKNGKQALECVETSRKYINDRAPSVKMLLEYVALNI